MTKERIGIPNKNSLRNLAQYSHLSDSEFDEMWERKTQNREVNESFESRIESKINEFAVDYALEDLHSNDLMTLRALAQAIMTLEDYELESYNLRTSEGVMMDNIALLDKMTKAMSDLRGDISRLQGDLGITRKVRKSDKESSVIATIEALKIKAKLFYDQKMVYIFCPKCHMLLSTIWTLYSDSEKNKITLVCERPLPDGKQCNNKFTVVIKDFVRDGANKESIPESMK